MEYPLYRVALATPEFRAGQFAALWALAMVLVIVPALVGATLGGLYASRGARTGWRLIRAWLSADRETKLLRFLLGRAPAPRAWDHLFSDRPAVYLRVRTVDGTWLAGRFAEQSYAGASPTPPISCWRRHGRSTPTTVSWARTASATLLTSQLSRSPGSRSSIRRWGDGR